MQRLLLMLSLAGLVTPAMAQRFDAHRPPAAQPAAESVGVDAARVQTFVMAGPHDRRYRIQVAALGEPPACGYRVLYLLDGNAAMAALTAAEQSPALGPGVLLVAVGYDTDAYFDTDARSMDYTPPLPGGRPAFDPRVPTRQGGGAEAFLDFLDQQLMPRIAAHWPVDARRRGIWGHSYGGMLALHALFRRPGMFSFYAAASPSLWWHAPLMEREAQAFVAGANNVAPASVLLMRGLQERRSGAGPASADDADLATMGRQLQTLPALHTQLRTFAKLGHGAMFSASLGPAIRAFVCDEAAQAACANSSASAAK